MGAVSNKEKKTIIKELDVKSKKEFFELHFSLSNFIFPVQLTNNEIQVLSAFLAETKDMDNIFTTENRKKIKQDLKQSAGGLANYLRTMTQKKFILKDLPTGKLSINPVILPKRNPQVYTFNLKYHASKE